jgi:hypothetical protein
MGTDAVQNSKDPEKDTFSQEDLDEKPVSRAGTIFHHCQKLQGPASTVLQAISMTHIPSDRAKSGNN